VKNLNIVVGYVALVGFSHITFKFATIMAF